MSCSTLQSLKSAPVVFAWSSSCSGAICGNLCATYSIHLPFAHGRVSQGHLDVLGWVYSPPSHVRTCSLHVLFVPLSSCPSLCPAGLWPLQCLHDSSKDLSSLGAVDYHTWPLPPLDEAPANHCCVLSGQFCSMSNLEFQGELHPPPSMSAAHNYVDQSTQEGEWRLWKYDLRSFLWQLVECLVVLVTYWQVGLICSQHMASLVRRPAGVFLGCPWNEWWVSSVYPTAILRLTFILVSCL